MKNVERLKAVPTWAWALTALGAVIVIWTSLWLDQACDVPGRRLVMKAIGGQGGGGGVGCFEFWLYRYQTLVAAITALVAALITVGAARKQLGEMRRQSAQQAFSALWSLKVQLADERNLLREIQTQAGPMTIFEENYLASMDSPHFALISVKEFEQSSDELSRLLRDFQISRGKTWSSRAQDLRSKVVIALIGLLRSVSQARHKIKSTTLPFHGTYNQADWDKVAPELVSIAMKDPVHALHMACLELEAELDKELARVQPALDGASRTAFGFS